MESDKIGVETVLLIVGAFQFLITIANGIIGWLLKSLYTKMEKSITELEIRIDELKDENRDNIINYENHEGRIQFLEQKVQEHDKKIESCRQYAEATAKELEIHEKTAVTKR